MTTFVGLWIALVVLSVVAVVSWLAAGIARLMGHEPFARRAALWAGFVSLAYLLVGGVSAVLL